MADDSLLQMTFCFFETFLSILKYRENKSILQIGENSLKLMFRSSQKIQEVFFGGLRINVCLFEYLCMV